MNGKDARDEEQDAGLLHWVNDIHQGDVLETLREMPESSVHTVVTSPPYYGLRDYGVDEQIGLEDTLDEYVATIVDVAEELRRVLRDDGSWWLNLGDTYAGSWGGQGYEGETKNRADAAPDKRPARNATLRRKSKMLVPHRVAIALEDEGWIVRSDAVWTKPNPMPHPVKDRLREDKEFVFHLTSEPDYWFDLDAIRKPHAEATINDSRVKTGTRWETDQEKDRSGAQKPFADAHPDGKNPGDIFDISVKPFPDAHFAVYPPELIETPIKASAPPMVCAVCGTPYERSSDDVPVWERDREEIEREQLRRALQRFDESDLTEEHLEAVRAKGFSDAAAGKEQTGAGRNTDDVEKLAEEAKEVLGGYFREFTLTTSDVGEFEQACDCPTVGDYTEPGIVLDPFAGAGTTALVAKNLGRRFVGIELNPDYVAMAQRRVGVTVDDPDRLLEDGETSLTAFADGGDRA